MYSLSNKLSKYIQYNKTQAISTNIQALVQNVIFYNKNVTRWCIYYRPEFTKCQIGVNK